jgi:hypothetical protein
MAKNKRDSNGSPAKTAAKGAAAYYAIKKLFKGAFVVAGVAAVAKVLRGDRAT